MSIIGYAGETDPGLRQFGNLTGSRARPGCAYPPEVEEPSETRAPSAGMR